MSDFSVTNRLTEDFRSVATNNKTKSSETLAKALEDGQLSKTEYDQLKKEYTLENPGKSAEADFDAAMVSVLGKSVESLKKADSAPVLINFTPLIDGSIIVDNDKDLINGAEHIVAGSSGDKAKAAKILDLAKEVLAEAKQGNFSGAFKLVAQMEANGLKGKPIDMLKAKVTELAKAGNGTGNTNPTPLEKCDAATFYDLKDEVKSEWYAKKLGPIMPDLLRSADKHGIPLELLETVIANELADIGTIDVFQEKYLSKGSLGIAQIQVQTAIDHKLVDVSEAEIKKYIDDHTEPPDEFSQLGHAPSREDALKELTAAKLKIPSVAVEASAREIKLLLTKILNNPGAWSENFIIYPVIGKVETADDLLSHVKGDTKIKKMENLARLITSAYNSPDILIAKKPGDVATYYDDKNAPYQNARNHGANATTIFRDIIRLGKEIGIR